MNLNSMKLTLFDIFLKSTETLVSLGSNNAVIRNENDSYAFHVKSPEIPPLGSSDGLNKQAWVKN